MHDKLKIGLPPAKRHDATRTASIGIGLTLVFSLVLGAWQGRTALSEKAATIKTGASQAAVVKLLGAPTWAVLPTDKGSLQLPDPDIRLELRWDNAPCFPVAVLFDRGYLVSGIDAGFLCKQDLKVPKPPDSMSCSKPDRRKYCQPMPR